MTLKLTDPGRSLPGPEDIYRTVLPNGITVLARSNPVSPSVAVSGYLTAGSLYDPPDKLGLASFTASCILRGTQTRSHQQLFDELESVGATLGFSASTHTLGFGGRCLVEDLPLLLRLMAECLTQPAFPADQVERVRSMTMTFFAIRAQDTGQMASLTFDETLYAGHPYGYPEDGNPETLAGISRQDLVDFHRKHYGPRGMVLGAAGAIEPEAFAALASEIFGSWTNPNQPVEPALPAVNPPTSPVRRHIFIPGKTQADLVMGTLGPRRQDAEYPAAALGNNILGQFGMMGRMGEVIREKSGLAYSASTSLNAGREAGSWEIYAGVNPANLEQTIALAMAEINRFIREPVSPDELSNSQSNFIGRLPLSLESNHGVVLGLVNLERYQLGLDYFLNYASTYQSITAGQILETARRFLVPSQFITISAGSQANEAE